MRSLCARHISRPSSILGRRCYPITASWLAKTILTRRWYAIELRKLDEKWRRTWQADSESYRSRGTETSTSRPDFVLPMFPYPSGILHLGHLRVYTIADVLARYRRLKGDEVSLPMGWDAFGLPAENAALERGIAPELWTRSNIVKMKEQLNNINASWDWDRELTTCDPEFYKHTQRLFLALFEGGLAYQAEAEVNYDPVDKTVLANEQVDANGCSWRSGAKVEKRKLKQWFFRISEFRDALLDDLDRLQENGAWPDHVLFQQRKWLGKSSGALVKFPILGAGHDMRAAIEVFTTRADTLFGVQYIALAATHPTVVKLARSDPELQAFLDTLPGLPADSKVGYLLPSLRAINPLAYHEEAPDATKVSLPVYVAPYVLGDYGEGAVMGVPGHDVRDHSFWSKHHEGQPVRFVLAASEDESTTAFGNEPFTDHGVMTEHSGPYAGKPSREAGEEIVKMLKEAKLATPEDKWRLRDWLISRQRYWGTPIPIIHCDSCGTVPVPDEDLPVRLPKVDQHWASGKTGNALESSPDFVQASCPKCHGPARRDTDTMDTFVDSSWYYARFSDPKNSQDLFSAGAGRSMPIHTYIGGNEHAILHLLYARFIYKFLATTPRLPQYDDKDVGGTQPLVEPFRRLVTQGMVHGKTFVNPETGRFLKPDELDLTEPGMPRVAATGTPASVSYEKMSKSKHNGVDPTDFIGEHGADPTRAHILFQAPVSDVLNWDGTKITGITRWLHRLHDQIEAICAEVSSENDASSNNVKDYLTEKHARLESLKEDKLAVWDDEVALWRRVQQTIQTTSQSYEEAYSLNTVVSDLMILTNALSDHAKASHAVRRAAASSLIAMLAPITPAFAEECWSKLHPESSSVFRAARFPEMDGSLPLLKPREQQCAVQINGKVRAVLGIPPPPADVQGSLLQEWMVSRILETEEGKQKFAGEGVAMDVRKAKRVIVVRGGKVVNFVM